MLDCVTSCPCRVTRDLQDRRARQERREGCPGEQELLNCIPWEEDREADKEAEKEELTRFWGQNPKLSHQLEFGAKSIEKKFKDIRS